MGIRENVADRLSGGRMTELQETAQRQAYDIGLLKESLQRLEQTLYSPGWRQLQMQADIEFTRDGLRQITELARIMKLKNPVILRSVTIQRLYVWAQGVTIRAKDEEINQVIQEFLDDERNRAELTTHQARGEKEEALQTDGNIFFRFFIDQVSGRVRVRTIDPQEIDNIVCNPDDKHEPWFYRRSFVRTGLDGSTKTITEYYPDWRYTPRSTGANSPATQLNGRIDWTTPVYHVAVNRMGNWGVSEFYAAMDWALAYKSFLENLASVWQALARFAWWLNTKGGKKGVAAAKTKLGTTLSTATDETNPPPVAGSTFISGEGVGMQPFRTAGATMSAEDGRRLFLMAISVTGFPETFYGDVSVGTLATAESLDRPTELKIRDRQTLWADIHRDILSFVLLWAVKAAKGSLSSLGKVDRQRDGDQVIEKVIWKDDLQADVDVEFPPVIDIDVDKYINALTSATTLNGQAPAGTLDLQTFTRLAAQTLGIEDVDALMDELFPDGEARTPALDPDQVAADEEAREAVFTATEQLLADLREVVGGNGHPN